MRSVIKKWGNSAAVRLPASILQSVRLDIDGDVDVREEDGRIIIEPIREKTYDLDELLDGINSKNLHKMVDFGDPVGKESL